MFWRRRRRRRTLLLLLISYHRKRLPFIPVIPTNLQLPVFFRPPKPLLAVSSPSTSLRPYCLDKAAASCPELFTPDSVARGHRMLVSRASALLRRRAQTIAKPLFLLPLKNLIPGPSERENANEEATYETLRRWSSASGSASSPSLSIWRRKKEMGKEGIFVVQTLKRLARAGDRGTPRLEAFLKSHVSRLVRTDLLAVLAEFQRQDLVYLSMKIYGLVRQEIWYRPDMYFYRDMILMLARNKRVEETRHVWADLKAEEVLFDQHTYGDIVRAFLDSGLPSLAMEFYDEMRSSPDPPLFLPFRVMLKGLIPYPELRQQVREDFVELFPHMGVYDPPEDLFDDPDN